MIRGPLPHFQVGIRVHEQRLLERHLADQEVLHPRDYLVAEAEHLHDFEG